MNETHWALRALDNAIRQTEQHNLERCGSTTSAKNVELREARDLLAKLLMPKK